MQSNNGIRLEDAADKITRETVLANHRTFVTAFDRSQILGLITALDDTIDLMKATGRRMLRYGVGFTPKMHGMADCIVRATRELRDGMPECRRWSTLMRRHLHKFNLTRRRKSARRVVVIHNTGSTGCPNPSKTS